MPAIDELINAEFGRNAGDEEGLLWDVDLNLFRAGKMTQLIIDGVLYPNNTIDEEGLAAAGFALLALLGQTAGQVRSLEQHFQNRRQHAPKKGAEGALRVPTPHSTQSR